MKVKFMQQTQEHSNYSNLKSNSLKCMFSLIKNNTENNNTHPSVSISLSSMITNTEENMTSILHWGLGLGLAIGLSDWDTNTM